MAIPYMAGQMPPITPRTNLATVTYPVTLATVEQAGRTTNPSDTIYTSDAPNNIDQFAILLTKKTNSRRVGTRHLPCFTRLNRLKAPGTSMKAKRQHLLDNLRFAGIAFTALADGQTDGSPNLIASVIGGSHTVMAMNVDHKTPLTPGKMVRWTIPKVDTHVLTKPPVVYHGDSAVGVFAELEEVTPESTAEEICNMLDMSEDEVRKTRFREHLNCKCTGTQKFSCKEVRDCVNTVLQEYFAMQEREIGTVIHDNGKGSVDIRLK